MSIPHALVTGATGFVGELLISRLENPAVLSRNAARARQSLGTGIRAFDWDPMAGPPPADALKDVRAVFHLAGDPVADQRWTAAKKQRIRDSRVLGTRNLVEGMLKTDPRPAVLVCASAVGIYGDRGDEELTEQSPAGDDFLAEVCQAWEREAARAAEGGIRVVSIRIGIVLGPGGGALAKMLTPFRLGLGSPLGSGRQWMPWIHREDLVRLLLFAAENETLSGPVNGSAPGPVTNREFTKTLGRVLSRPTFFPPVPGFMLKLLVGGFAEVLLGSQRVVPQAARDAGFTFEYGTLEPALREILQKK